MANSFVQLNTGTGGAKAQTFQNTVGGNVVDANAVALIDTAGNPLISDTATTGTITATDAVVAAPAGAGAFVSGSSTAGSISAVVPRAGDAIWNCQITGLTTGTLWFEGSLDSTNGTDGNWIVLNALRDGVLASIIQQSATANGMYSGNVAGLSYLRVRSIGTLSGTPAVRWRLSSGASEVYLASSIPPGTNALGQVDGESRRATYGYGGGPVTPGANATDVLAVQGSATKTVKIRRLTFTGLATTAGTAAVALVRRSAANTGGTFAAQGGVKYDNSDAAATAVVNLYTANPTALGASVGVFRQERLLFALAANGAGRVSFTFSDVLDKAFTLRGTAEFFCVSFLGNAVPSGATFDWHLETTEE